MKNFFEGKKLHYMKIRKACQKCGTEFVTYIPTLDSNGTGIESPSAMGCDKCNRTEFSDTEADPFFKHIKDHYLKRYTPDPNTLWTTYPWSKDIYKQFEKTFENCNCGGRFTVLGNVCPNCGFEPDYKNAPKEISSQKMDFIIHLAKHKPFKSLSDIEDTKLKEIFKDFDFSKLKSE